MNNLMNNSNKDFEKFREKYKNFLVPSYLISIDSKKIDENDFNIEEINISLSNGGKAAIAYFSITDCYNISQKSFSSEIKSKLKLGSKISISLGYNRKNEELFMGYIDSVSYEFEGIPKINVFCMDVMSILMQNITIEQKKKDKSLSDLVKEILNRYKNFISESEIGNIQAEEYQAAQSIDDYSFIKSIAEENNFEFFQLAGKVYFRKSKSVKTPITTLTHGENILYFKREIKYRNIKVTAYGKNYKDKKNIRGDSTAKTDYPYIQSTFVSNRIIQSGRIDTVDKAKKRAEAAGKKYIEDAYSAEIECIGIPELIPGRYIKLDGFDKDIDNTYYITQADHNFTPGKYTVSMNLSSSK